MGMQERLRELCHFNTTFGNATFNIVSCLANMAQIIATCILMGAFRSDIAGKALVFLWYPVLESFRLFVLTIARVDVLMKDFEEIQGNQRSFAQTRNTILFCNGLGASQFFVALPLYLVILSLYAPNSTTFYLICMVLFPAFMVTRMCLSIPMFLAFGGKPLYRLHNGNDYERIGDGPRGVAATNRNSDSEIRGSNQSANPMQGNGPNGGVPHEVMSALYEERQMQIAMDRSRRESERSLRMEQDREFMLAEERQRAMEEAAEEARMLEEARRMSLEENLDDDGDDLAAADGGGATDEIPCQPAIVLDPLPGEPDESNETVLARVRLPNGTRLTRRFKKDSTMAEMKLWVAHELQSSGNEELIGQFRLISTMPRTAYDEDGKTMMDLKFWKGGHSRQLSTPLLYVEDLE